jgi:Ca2+/H+ antiporter
VAPQRRGFYAAVRPPPALFFSAALSSIPVAKLIVTSTGQLATCTGDAVGSLLLALVLAA